MNKSNKVVHIFFTPDEAKILTLGLGLMIQDLNSATQDPNIPWDPETRKHMAEMNRHARNAAGKLEKFTGIKSELPPYVDGDEEKFFTKPS